MTVEGPLKPIWISSSPIIILGSNLEIRKDSMAAYCFSMAAKAVLRLMLSHSVALPALRLSFLLRRAMRLTGALMPLLSAEVDIACIHPCCGLLRPLGSKLLSTTSRWRRSSSLMECILILTSLCFSIWTTRLHSSRSCIVGDGKQPDRMPAQLMAATVPRSCEISSSSNRVLAASFFKVLRLTWTAVNLFWT